ncbi:NAD(P)H-binding protein [Streptomyces marincola]|uniref:NAD(P)-dependent oxidoreductase n=1 Tax=Streptomyces marincola TaxID=2878388 RepID=A0A1W7CXD4_9ACTN|nr:NAD(P)H-binding protein [Streptomyces marincola]ARQ69396.1 NAD(P)-dependent oxidoreductase [Streptomyces marincola]
MSENSYLVLGGTGKTGRRVVRRLRAADLPVRVAARSGEVRFDWERRETWRPALDGAHAVYLVAPDDPGPVGEFVDLAVATGVRRFVVLSGRGADAAGGIGPSVGQVAAERAAMASGVEWTLLRPNNFNQNFTEDLWLQPLRAGRVALPIGDVPEPFIDAEDIAEVAVAALTGDRHAGQAYDLSGPAGPTWRGAVATIAEATGRDIVYEELTPERYRAELAAEGVPPAFVEALDGMFALHRSLLTAEAADGVRRVLGREPVAFGDWAARTAATGVWS